VECKLRWVNLRRISDPRREFRPAFRLTGISDDCYRSTMGVITISSRTPRSAGENFGCTREHLGAPASSLVVPLTSLGVPMTSWGAPTMGLGAPGSTTNHCKAVREKRHLLWERCWCAWKSKLILIVQQFLKLMYSVCIIIYISI